MFLLCLMLSIFLWILVHLSKEYFYTAEYRLDFTQVPWNMKMVSCSDSTLFMTIRLQGYEYFSQNLFRKKKRECEVSLKGLKIKIGDDQVFGYLLTRGIARNIAEQSSYPLEVFATSPDTIFFTFDKKSLKHIPGNSLKPGTHLPDTTKLGAISVEEVGHGSLAKVKTPVIIKSADVENRSDRKHR